MAHKPSERDWHYAMAVLEAEEQAELDAFPARNLWQALERAYGQRTGNQVSPNA